MSNRILVTYASRAGSTAGVAEAIGETLRESGAQVEVRPVNEVRDVKPYQAVVVGSAIQERAWLPEALEFIEKHRTALSRKSFAVFLVCITLAMPHGDEYREEVAGWLKPVRALVHPVSEGLFAGALDIGKIPSFGDRLKFRLSVAAGIMPEGDHRDWKAIRTWASELAARLAPVLPEAADAS